jgi:hypothetical protein
MLQAKVTSPPQKKPGCCKVEIPGNFSNLNKREIAMKKSKFTEPQIVFAIKQSETGVKVE